MNKTTTLKATGVSLAIIVGSTLAVTAANAQHGGSEEDRSARITELAERFDLDENEVKSYMDEKQQERQAEHEEKRAEHVSGLIESGTLTQAQADELTALKGGFKTEVEALKESGAERSEIKAAMESNRAEVKAWATTEGINLADVMPDKGEHGERKGHRGHDKNEDVSAESTES